MDESAERNTSQIGERMRIFRESINFTQEQMAESFGGTKRGLQDNEWGRAAPNSKVLIGLARRGLNINWLLLGDGPMLLADLQTASGANTAGAADLHAYGECLEILELALNKFNRKLDPEKKRAAVDSLYRAWLRDKQIDPQLLDIITQLAA